jgi:uncharacterized radical SAM superfamily Fe-S cluster-containing enzyme
MTQSLCPECLTLVQAKIVVRNDRVYFRKHCPTHGTREDFVCSDVAWFDRTEYSLPGKVPTRYGADVKKGCPYDCGLCTEHEQHTCIGLLEITSHCNLECPICFASSGPGGDHLTFEQCKSAIDRLVEVETQPEVLQLSGGEPTIHPQFERILRYACDQPIDIVMINTNGIRIAKDPLFVQMLAELKQRCEVYFQFDSFEELATTQIRGLSLVETKLNAIEILGQHGIRTTLVCTLQSGVNESQIGPLAQFALERPWITGLSFQPTTYTGRHFLPQTLESRITFPDVIKRLESQTENHAGQQWLASDFAPLPCAHPNGHSLAYAYRQFSDDGVKLLPLARFIDFEKHLDLLSGRITFDRERAQSLLQTFLQGIGCGGLSGRSCADDAAAIEPQMNVQFEKLANSDPLIGEFLRKALTQALEPEDMLRVTTTSFMDAYNFDVRQLMKSCVHHLLPSGHIIPFSAYNVLYREGHVELPVLSASDCGTGDKLVSLGPLGADKLS